MTTITQKTTVDPAIKKVVIMRNHNNSSKFDVVEKLGGTYFLLQSNLDFETASSFVSAYKGEANDTN